MSKLIGVLLALVSFVSPVWAYSQIPETLRAGDYSISLKCDERWAAQVFEKQGVVVYSFHEKSQGGISIQLRVHRVSLPVDASLADDIELASRLVRDDGLKFKRTVFRKRFRLPKEPAVVECPVGKAVVYGSDRAVFQDEQPHFARAALVLPKDYKSRLVGYLVIGHQAGGGLLRVEQAEYFDALLQSLREITPE